MEQITIAVNELREMLDAAFSNGIQYGEQNHDCSIDIVPDTGYSDAIQNSTNGVLTDFGHKSLASCRKKQNCDYEKYLNDHAKELETCCVDCAWKGYYNQLVYNDKHVSVCPVCGSDGIGIEPIT